KILALSRDPNNPDDDLGTLKRYNADGTLDTAFGTNGAATDIPSDAQFPFYYGLAATADAGALILVADGSDAPDAPGAISLIGADGRTNRAFARSLDPDSNDTVELLAQSDGKVLGTAGATLFRYNNDGTAD